VPIASARQGQNGDVDEASGVRLLWSSDWHDGPVSGLCEYEGTEYWFEAARDEGADDYEHPRRFLLRELTQAENAREWERHRLFEATVGTQHCQHDGAPPPSVRPREEWGAFYDRYPVGTAADYSARPVVGQFRLNST
jgi:hypothetical protein